jgi:hypothetical protein
MNWQLSLGLYFVIFCGALWSCLRHAVPHLTKTGKLMFASVVSAIICLIGVVGTVKQYRREHDALKMQPNSFTQTDAEASPVERPIEIVSFDSEHGLTIQNFTSREIYVIDIALSQDIETRDLLFGFPVAPKSIGKHTITDERLRTFSYSTLPMIGDSWKELYKDAEMLLGEECLLMDYFTPNDPGLKTLTDFYAEDGKSLARGKAQGVLHYRIAGSQEGRSETIPLFVTVLKRDSCKVRKEALKGSK